MMARRSLSTRLEALEQRCHDAGEAAVNRMIGGLSNEDRELIERLAEITEPMQLDKLLTPDEQQRYQELDRELKQKYREEMALGNCKRYSARHSRAW